MSSVQTKTLITLTLKLPDLEIDCTKEVSLDQLRRINAQIARLYEDSNLILGKISLSTHSSCTIYTSFSAEKLEVASNWIKTQTKPFTLIEFAEQTKITRSACYDILAALEAKKLIERFKVGPRHVWNVVSVKTEVKPATPGGIDAETVEQANFRREVAEQKASELKARMDSR